MSSTITTTDSATASIPLTAAASTGSINTILNYSIVPANGERPWTLINAPADGSPRSNLGESQVPTEVHDIRTRKEPYGMDKTGFDFFKSPTEMKYEEWASDETIEKKYYPEVIELLKKHVGASRVQIFDHTVRRGAPPGVIIPDTPSTRQPVGRVHVDQTPESATRRVHRHLPAEDVDKLLAGRYILANLWRPFETVYDTPLAVCDFTTLDTEKDLVPTALIYPDMEGETYTVTYNPKHTWYSPSHQQPDEVLLLKCYDNKAHREPGSVAALTPHTAFKDERFYGKEGVRPRESIEVRCLVFSDE